MFSPRFAHWLSRKRGARGSPAPRWRQRPQLESLEDRLALAGFLLTNGPGEATLSVAVDGYGSFGASIGVDAGDLFYHPVGAATSGPTTFESGVAIVLSSRDGSQPGDIATFLTSGNIGGSGLLPSVAVNGTSTAASSSFTIFGLSFTLTQTLVPLLQNGVQTGTALVQTYTATNITSQHLDFSLFRYFDGDLRFNGDITDGGGRLFANGTEILFETDTATGTISSTTFIGITATGGSVLTAGRYEVDSFAGLRGRILVGVSLDDSIRGDGPDADQFIDADEGYDVTLALRNFFSLAPGQSATYTTQTLAGTGVPEVVTPPPEEPPPPPEEPPPPLEEPPPPPEVLPSPALTTPVSVVPIAVVPITAANNTLPQLGIALLDGAVSTASQRGDDNVGLSLALGAARARAQTSTESPNFASSSVLVAQQTTQATSPEVASVGTGSISGAVFVDANGNGRQEAGEIGLAGQTVYLDLNGDGVYQETEPAAVTNSKGEYLFQGLRLDTYSVRQVLWEHIEQTYPVITPASSAVEKGGHLVTLSSTSPTSGEKNFGAIQVNVIRRPLVRPTVPTPPPASTEPKDGTAPTRPAPAPEAPPENDDPGFRHPGEDDFDLDVPPPNEADNAFLAALASEEEETEPIEQSAFPWKPLVLSGAAVLFWVQLAGHRRAMKEDRSAG